MHKYQKYLQKISIIKFIGLYLLLTTFACSPKITILNIKDVNIDKIENNSEIYFLPKTTIRIELEAKKTNFIAGPYADYAEKFLGIKNAESSDYSKWKIEDVQISNYNIADTSQIYIIQSKKYNIKNLIELSEDGIIQFSKNNTDRLNFNTNVLIDKIIEKNIDFTILSNSENFYEKTTNSYKTIKSDSSFIRVPVSKTEILKKSTEQKAEELSKLILKLRQEKISLLIGEYDTFPDGIAMKAIIKELNALEKDYISLFVGYTIENAETQRRIFEICPNNIIEKNDTVLCKFTLSDGFVSAENEIGEEIKIEFKAESNNKIIQDYYIRQDSTSGKNNSIIYRIPVLTRVNIFSANNILASSKLLISQFGSVCKKPVKLNKKQRHHFEFQAKFN